jgi:hypothetical protein
MRWEACSGLRTMRQPGPIADYAAALARGLRFDIALARRVRAEVEDHLWETADELGGASPDNQLRAIASFGDADDLARQYAADCLLAQTQQLSIAVALAVIGVFLAMESRVVWYIFTQWEADATLKHLAAIALPLDHYAFLTAVACAVFGFGYLVTRRAPADFHAVYRRQFGLGLSMCIAATFALLAAVGIEIVMTCLRIAAAPVSLAIAVPALTVLAEIALVIAVIFRIAAAIRYAAIAGALAP